MMHFYYHPFHCNIFWVGFPSQNIHLIQFDESGWFNRYIYVQDLLLYKFPVEKIFNFDISYCVNI